MTIAFGDFLQQPAAKRWGTYLAKAVVLLGAFCLVGHFSPNLPSAVVAIVWAAMSAVSAVGVAYHAVIRKTHRQFKLERGGALARLNEGRALCLIGGFAVSAVCMAGLMLEAPKWEAPEWALVVLSIPLYLGAFALVQKYVSREYAPMFRTAAAARWSVVIVGAALCVLYGIVSLVEPAASYASASEAFLAAEQPFADTSSALMGEAGKLTGLVDGLAAYGMSEAAQVSPVGYIAWRVVISASAFFGIANLLGLCSIELAELKRVFLPLETDDKPASASRVGRRHVAVAVALPVCLAAAFLVADGVAAHASETEEYTAAERFVRDQVGIAVYVLDGKYYDHQAVQDLIEETKQKSASLSEEARAALVPLINESCDARIANVESYLDWYYSLPADYERLAHLVTGSVESFVADQFSEKIEQGVDDSQLVAQLSSFSEQAAALESAAMEEMLGYELSDVPDWLVTTKDAIDAAFLSEPLEPTSKMLEASERIGISAATGAGAGVVAKVLVEKAMSKQFFSKIVAKITGTLSSRAVGGAIGGAAGTIAGPAGTIAGIAAGTALGVGVDYLLLNIDEMQNRETYKAEIVDAIEEQRADMLAVVE